MKKTQSKHPELFPRAPVEKPESTVAMEDVELTEEDGDTGQAPDSNEEEPTREEWLALFGAAARFKEARPWEHMYDADMFGVREPESGITGYCSVMGRGGKHFALGVFPGGEGINSYRFIAEASHRGHELELGVAGSMQKCIMASFEDRGLLSDRDRKLIKDLGLKFRGRNAWPQFQRHDPVFQPWYLDSANARFLTTALEQALPVADRFQADESYLLGPLKANKVLVRVTDGRDGSWADRIEPFERYEGFEIARSEQVMAALAVLPVQTGFVLDIPYGVMPTLIGERGQRGYFPHGLLLVDGNKGLALGVHMLSPEQFPSELLNTVATSILKLGIMPEQIRLSSQLLYRVLAPEFEGYKTSIGLYESLPQGEHVFKELFSSFAPGW